jgi:hypothetical protein
MKQIKHLSMAAAITLIFAITTPAGEIHTGELPPPPPSGVPGSTDLVPSTLDAEILLIFLQLFSA